MTMGPEEIERRVAIFIDTCRRSGVKITHQRIEIYREVASSSEHPDAETIYRAVRGRMPTVSLDTVYRTMWFLHDLGMVSTLGQRHDSVRFDANLAPHHHFVCMRCGLALDFESPELNALAIPDSVRELGSVRSSHVELRGVCRKCSGSLAKSQPFHATERSEQ